MASAWGSSWSASWNGSWGALAATARDTGAGGGGRKKRRIFEDEQDVWLYIEALKSQFHKAMAEQHAGPVYMEQPALPEVISDAPKLAYELRTLRYQIGAAKRALGRFNAEPLPDIAKLEAQIEVFKRRAEEDIVVMAYAALARDDDDQVNALRNMLDERQDDDEQDALMAYLTWRKTYG